MFKSNINMSINEMVIFENMVIDKKFISDNYKSYIDLVFKNCYVICDSVPMNAFFQSCYFGYTT